tara:strand:- start:211 stop:1254 length:1044 start_codon:yes stop_codon:yes gene_type:complete
MKFKAAVLSKQKKPLNIIELETKSNLKRGQVLVKLFYSGICGSQIGEILGVKGKDHFLPHLLGHEGTGVVKKIGKNIKKIKVGDKVILHWQKSKGINSQTPHYTFKKKKINSGWVTTFNEYSIVSENRLTKLPNKISSKRGILFGCSLTTAYGTLKRNGKIKSKDKILIIGTGNIGLAMIYILNLIGCKNIIAIDKNIKKLKIAKSLGAKKTFLLKKKDKLTSEIIRSLDGSKPNKIFENSGDVKMIEFAYEILDKIGILSLVGVPYFKKKIKINTLPLHLGKKIVGSFGGGGDPAKDIYELNKLIKSTKTLDLLLGEEFNLKSINTPIKKMIKNKLILKPIINFKK